MTGKGEGTMTEGKEEEGVAMVAAMEVGVEATMTVKEAGVEATMTVKEAEVVMEVVGEATMTVRVAVVAAATEAAVAAGEVAVMATIHLIIIRIR